MSENNGKERRVVITGIGVVSPVGIGADNFWKSLSTGQSGIGPIESLSYSASPQNVGGEVKDFTVKSARKEYLKTQRKSIKVMCREIQMGVASAMLAVEHSGLNLDEIDHNRLGVDFGANLMLSPPDVLGHASTDCIEEEGDEIRFLSGEWGKSGLPNMEPLWLLRYLPNMPACHIGISVDARGPNNSVTLDEASGNLSLGEAKEIIKRNAADVMIAGTTGTRVHPVKTTHARLWDELAESEDDPSTWSKPFDKNRTGQVISEGACSFILEEEEHAKKRGAEIYAVIRGTASSCVVSKEGIADNRKALVNVINSALKEAGLTPSDIGHINAHGLGTRVDDAIEYQAIKDVFGDAASEIPVTALKSVFGNPGASCGSLELAGSILGLKNGVVPPTLNFSESDPECPLNIVHGEPLKIESRIALNINVTRIGQASAAIIEAV
jgi:3-oxoacyl-[acyl-carrier-protein] synthase II